LEHLILIFSSIIALPMVAVRKTSPRQKTITGKQLTKVSLVAAIDRHRQPGPAAKRPRHTFRLVQRSMAIPSHSSDLPASAGSKNLNRSNQL
jgi:hypothetical protein